MPVRATKRGAARVPFPTGADADVLICGASFAGLTVARELRATGARVLVLDRYEIGERQTSACAAPTEWLRNLGLEASIRQTFDSLLVHTPRRRARPLAAPVHVLHLRLPPALRPAVGAVGRGRVRDGQGRSTARASRCVRTAATSRAPLIVDALGWRRVLGPGDNFQPPGRAALARPGGASGRASATTSSCGSTRATSTPATAGRSPRATSCASASARSTRTTRSSSRRCGWSRTSRAEPHGYQGNWIPHRIRPATEDGVFFAGDSAGHCLPLTAEGIRTAFYFGIALGRELRAVLEGRQDRAAALKRYGAFSGVTPLEVRVDLPGPAVDPAPARAPAGRADADLHAPQGGAVGVPALPGDRAAAVRACPRPPPPAARRRESRRSGYSNSAR